MRRSQLVLLACVLAAAAIPVTLAFAQTTSVPTVTSAPATSVSNTGATLNGTVNPNGAATQFAFQYGPTASYGEETTLTSDGSGTTAGAVNGTLTGLQSGTMYHFRVIAINAAGDSVGTDQTLTTTGTAPAPATPPVATTGSATGVAQAGATLGGTVDPKGQATTFYFEYGTSTDYGYETNPQTDAATASSGPVSATLSSLTSGTTYHFRVVAVSPGGVTLGSDATFTTTTPPTATSAPATGVTSDSATFNGTVNPDGNPTTYYFEYGTTTSYGLQTAPANAGSGTTGVTVNTNVTGLMPSTTYHFRLVSTSSGGTNDGSDQTFTTTGPPTVTSVVRLMGHMGFVSPGNVIGVEVGCFGPTSCSGAFKMTVDGKTIGTGNFKENADTGGFQNIKLNSTGQRDLEGNHVDHLLVTNVAVTTTAGQSVNGTLSLARWSWKDI